MARPRKDDRQGAPTGKPYTRTASFRLAPAEQALWRELVARHGGAPAALEWLLVRFGSAHAAYLRHLRAAWHAEDVAGRPVLTCVACHRVCWLSRMCGDMPHRSADNPLGLLGCKYCKPRGPRPWAQTHRLRADTGIRHPEDRLVTAKFPSAQLDLLGRLGEGIRGVAFRDLLHFAQRALAREPAPAQTVGEGESLDLFDDLPAAMPRWME